MQEGIILGGVISRSGFTLVFLVNRQRHYSDPFQYHRRALGRNTGEKARETEGTAPYNDKYLVTEKITNLMYIMSTQ
jgi:hypothetical protein